MLSIVRHTHTDFLLCPHSSSSSSSSLSPSSSHVCTAKTKSDNCLPFPGWWWCFVCLFPPGHICSWKQHPRLLLRHERKQPAASVMRSGVSHLASAVILLPGHWGCSVRSLRKVRTNVQQEGRRRTEGELWGCLTSFNKAPSSSWWHFLLLRFCERKPDPRAGESERRVSKYKRRLTWGLMFCCCCCLSPSDTLAVEQKTLSWSPNQSLWKKRERPHVTDQFKPARELMGRFQFV